MHGLADRRAYGVALEGRFGQAYNEQAFRYFLQLERKRAARAKRPVLLLLMSLKKTASSTRIDPALASRLFYCLWGCLRETDVIGWYREDRVVGAVLTNLDGECRSDVTATVRQRIDAAVAARLVQSDVARHLRVRVYQCRPQLKG